MIVLTRTGTGELTEVNQHGDEVYWTLTSYTEPREFTDECADCGREIEEWDLYVCLDDGSECAHTGCVEVRER